MEPVSLQETILINISIGLWMEKDLRPYTVKKSSAPVDLGQALPLLEKKVDAFPVASPLKNRLMDLVQRTGYELHEFLNKFTKDEGLKPEKVEWTSKGTVDEIKSLRRYIRDANNYSEVDLLMAGKIFDEISVKKIWFDLSAIEKCLYKQYLSKSVFESYWIYKLENRLPDFVRIYRSSIVGFNINDDINVNMFWHSVAFNNLNAVYYFYNKITEKCEQIWDKNFEYNLLRYVIESGRKEGFTFVLSILEKPIIDEQSLQLIMSLPDNEYLINLFSFLLDRQDTFGDLHLNIFRDFLLRAKRKRPTAVEEFLRHYDDNILTK